MSRNGIAGFLTVSVWYGSEANCRDFLDELEDSLEDLADDEDGIAPSVSSASERADGWVENVGLEFQDLKDVERVAVQVVSLIRSLGIPDGCLVDLQKREILGKSERIWCKRVLQDADTSWGHPPEQAKETVHLPPRIAYLSSLVEKYYLVGGDEAVNIFPAGVGIEEFHRKLSEGDAQELHSAYEQMIAAGDHLWMNAWLAEDDNVTNEKVQAFYFLAFLDRLNEYGFSGDEYVTLADWDSLM